MRLSWVKPCTLRVHAPSILILECMRKLNTGKVDDQKFICERAYQKAQTCTVMVCMRSMMLSTCRNGPNRMTG